MATLREIKKRLQTVENIKQITSAMEKVATARLRQADPKAKHSKIFHAKLTEMMNRLKNSEATASHLLLNEKKEIKKTALIVVSADGGHCGSYNSLLLQAADRFARKYAPNMLDLVLLGNKAIQNYRSKKYSVRLKVPHWGGKITHQEVQEISQQCAQWYLKGELDEIWVVYTHYVSPVKRKVHLEKFIPFISETSEIPPDAGNLIVEPALEDLYQTFIPFYLAVKLQAVLDDAYAAELAARVFSMRTATKNAKELIESLTLYRNKVRQAGITKEMLEITSSAKELI